MTIATASPPQLLDNSKIRSDFPVLSRTVASGAPLAFLDNAASAQRPTAVIDAISDCYERYYANVHRGIHTLSEESTQAYEQARGRVATFLNTRSHREIIFTAGTTAAINTVARTWGDDQVKTDDVILVTIAEHHANIVPWHQLAARTGCRVEFLPIDENFDIEEPVVTEALQRLRPKLFAFVAASNTLGTEFPVKRWCELARQHGAATLVDAAQWAPHHAIDVQDWDADFVVFSGHKVCGPSGIGVLYGRESILEAIPPFLGGGGMIHQVTTTGFTSAELPDKFEAGTPPIAQAIGLAAAIDYIDEIGLDRISAHQRALGQRADAELRQLEGVSIVGPVPARKSGIVSFHIKGVHAHDVSHQLDQAGIAVRAGHHCTMPLHKSLGISATARASFYLYNTLDEADRFVDAIVELQKKFAPTGRKRRRRSNS